MTSLTHKGEEEYKEFKKKLSSMSKKEYLDVRKLIGNLDDKLDSRTDKVLRRWANYGNSFWRVMFVFATEAVVVYFLARIIHG